MSDLQNFAAGYNPAILALLLVFAYYSFVTLFRRGAPSRHISVPSYSVPAGASPAVAAWLLERNDLPRAVAAALVNMAAKGHLKIEQSKGLFSVVKLAAGTSVQLEPEEYALAYGLFRNCDTFDFEGASRQLADAIKAFRTALLNTSYMSTSTAWFVPAWIVSSCAIGFALFQGTANLPHPSASSGRSVAGLVLLTFWCLSVALRTLSGPLQKLTSRLPGSTAPRRPWTGADGKPIIYLLASFLGVGLLGLVTSRTTGMITATFLVINVAFFHAMQDLTPAGTEVLDRLNDYKRFLSAVDAGPISQLNSPEEPPVLLTQKNAYAIAFHVDRGWGEQFASSIAGVIECTEVFHRPSEERSID